MKRPLMLLYFLLSFSLFNFSPVEAQVQSLSLVSYNLGLAHEFVPYASQRRPHLIKALQSLSSDVLCLQEVWTDEDRELIRTSLTKEYPYAHWVAPLQKYTDKSPACYPTDLIGEGKFGSCLYQNCLRLKGDEFTQCILTICQESLYKLKKDNNRCAGALFSQVGKSPLSAIATVINPFSKVGLFAYEGQAGVLLLSRHPLEAKDVLELSEYSTSNRRAGLYAEVKFKNHHYPILCTHLTANLSRTIPYTGDHFQSWSEENFFQSDKIISYMETKAGERPHIIVGDFNAGPGISDLQITPEFEQSYALFAQRGYVDHFILSKPQCTFCADNTLNARGVTGTTNTGIVHNPNIDHIFVKNFPVLSRNHPHSHLMRSGRMFDQVVSIPEIAEGKGHLSDHYGVWLEMPVTPESE